MHKIFNRNTVKISYSCLRNISSIISSHNLNILSPKEQSFGSNFRVKNECSLNGECQTPSVIYRAYVVKNSNDGEKFYFGLTDNTFKEKHSNHNRDFKHEKYENSTELTFLTEKLWIINFINDENMLNKKSELISKCRHLNKNLLRNVKKK